MNIRPLNPFYLYATLWRGGGCARKSALVVIGVMTGLAAGTVRAADPKAAEAPVAQGEPSAQRADAQEAAPRFNVRQIRVRGAKTLDASVIESAIYPYLGKGRTTDDLEAARAALEKAYKDKGHQTVAVEIPQQSGTRGIIYMDVVENRVGRLRVHGAKWFSADKIKKGAPSLAEGTIPDFKAVEKDIIALNGWPDRRVTPVLRPGIEPGTVDVDLNVEDKMPLHGSIELNNRYSPDTTELRLNGAVNYNNLWQLGHSLGLAAQIAPQRLEDAEVYSGYYIARFAQAPDFSLMFMGTKQNSDVSTLGGSVVAGRGEILGVRTMFSLPRRGNYFHSLGFGLDYKSFDENITLADSVMATPIDYYPITLEYGGGWTGENYFTEFNASVNFHLRGLGSKPEGFDAKRYDSDGSYLFFRGDLSHTQDLPAGFEGFAKAQVQLSNDPLVNSEQFSGGGLSSVRGYLESEALGDSGWFLTAELRTPSLFQHMGAEIEGQDPEQEWRWHVFIDGGQLFVNDILPGQEDSYNLASIGLGSRLMLWNHLNGSFDLAWPLIDQAYTKAGDAFLSFRLWADF